MQICTEQRGFYSDGSRREKLHALPVEADRWCSWNQQIGRWSFVLRFWNQLLPISVGEAFWPPWKTCDQVPVAESHRSFLGAWTTSCWKPNLSGLGHGLLDCRGVSKWLKGGSFSSATIVYTNILSKEVGKQYFRVTNDFYLMELTMMKGGTWCNNT